MSPVEEEATTFLAQFQIEALDFIEDQALLEFIQNESKTLGRDLGCPQEGIGAAYLPTSGNRLIIARKDGLPTGFIAWQEWSGMAFIGMAWTAPEYRRCGLYAGMVKVLRGQAAAQGFTQIMACVHGNNHASLKAHERIFGRPVIVNFQMATDETK
jgi:hypothetical protein